MPQNTFGGTGTSEELGCTEKKSLTVTKKVQTAADVICACHAGDIQDVTGLGKEGFWYIVVWEKMLENEGNLHGEIMSLNMTMLGLSSFEVF